MIIKNCPAYSEFTKQCKGIYKPNIKYQYCSGNSNCIIKQIAQKCKTSLQNSYWPVESDILNLLEIEETNE